MKFLKGDLKNIVENFIHCWNISENFYEHLKKNDLSFSGIKPYEFEHYNTFNKFLTTEKQKFYNNQGKPFNQLKTVKSQIISVLHPLTFEFISIVLYFYFLYI